MAYFIQGDNGPARDKWPQNIAIPHQVDPGSASVSTISTTLEGIAEKTVVEARRTWTSDKTRRMGIFVNDGDEQQPVFVKVYGFVKSCNLRGNGDWKGSEYSASRAMLWLELESKGCIEAFNPQLVFLRNARLHAAQALEGGEDSELYETLLLRHVVFRKTSEDEVSKPPTFARGEDPTGKLKHLAKDWRLNKRPTFRRLDDKGNPVITTPASFNVGDFVEVIASLDVVYKNKRGKGPNEVEVHLAMSELTRIFSDQELKEMQIPAALTLLTAPQTDPSTSMLTDNV